MPTYDYDCPSCGLFDAVCGVADRQTECACGQTAERRPFSGIPYLIGGTVVSTIPDPVERHDAEQRAFTKNWGTAERSYELLRKARVEDKQGRVSVDMRGLA